MKIQSVLNDDKSCAWSVTDAPEGTVIELRFQNTMNGSSSVIVVDTDEFGRARVPYFTFGQHIAVSARVLTAEQAHTVHEFTYDGSVSDKHLSLSTATKPKTPTVADHAASDSIKEAHNV